MCAPSHRDLQGYSYCKEFRVRVTHRSSIRALFPTTTPPSPIPLPPLPTPCPPPSVCEAGISGAGVGQWKHRQKHRHADTHRKTVVVIGRSPARVSEFSVYLQRQRSSVSPDPPCPPPLQTPPIFQWLLCRLCVCVFVYVCVFGGSGWTGRERLGTGTSGTNRELRWK